MPVAAAIAGAAVIGGGASIISANKAAKASKKAAQTAADASTKAAEENNALQREIYGENKAVLAPYVAAGTAATPAIQSLLGLTDDRGYEAAFRRYQDSTGYGFRVGEGQKAVLSGLGARGMLESGAAQKALLKYGQGVASDEFGRYLGYLGGQQDVGRSAASAQAGVATGFANAVGANNTNAANVTGQAALSAGNAQANAALSVGSNVNSALGSALSAYTFNQGLGSSYGTPPVLGPGYIPPYSYDPSKFGGLGRG